MDAQELIAKLGETLGFSLSLSQENTCQVIFDADAIDFEATGKDLFIMAELGAEIDNSNVFKRLLQANHLGAETGGASIGLAVNGFVLHRQLAMPMEYQDFENIVANFIQTTRYWKEWLALPHQSMAEGDGNLTAPQWDMIRV